MNLEITKVGNWQDTQYHVSCLEIEGLFIMHPHLPLAMSNFATLLQEYYESLISREPQLAPNLKREFEMLKELFNG